LDLTLLNAGTIQEDHRYLMARLIAGNLTLTDLARDVGFMDRWGGSIGNGNYLLWLNTCDLNTQNYSTARQSGPTAVLIWFNNYAECYRQGQFQNGTPYEENYNDIMGQITRAIEDQVNGIVNPVQGMAFVKHTSVCYVWQYDANGYPLTCYGGNDSINFSDFIKMKPFCNQKPRLGETTDPEQANRNCGRTSGLAEPGFSAATWLGTSAADTPMKQQMGLDTVVGAQYTINLGLYIPDRRILNSVGDYESGIGCNTGCYYLAGNPTVTPFQETVPEAWVRHWERFYDNPGDDIFYNPGTRASKYMHVLRIESEGAQTWITYVFQAP
jgi:hypothetical protein